MARQSRLHGIYWKVLTPFTGRVVGAPQRDIQKICKRPM